MHSTLRGLQLPLPVDADLRHDQVPAVALDLVVGQRRQLAGRFTTAPARRPRPTG